MRQQRAAAVSPKRNNGDAVRRNDFFFDELFVAGEDNVIYKSRPSRDHSDAVAGIIELSPQRGESRFIPLTYFAA
jgi:hypothetical protein